MPKGWGAASSSHSDSQDSIHAEGWGASPISNSMPKLLLYAATERGNAARSPYFAPDDRSLACRRIQAHSFVCECGTKCSDSSAVEVSMVMLAITWSSVCPRHVVVGLHVPRSSSMKN